MDQPVISNQPLTPAASSQTPPPPVDYLSANSSNAPAGERKEAMVSLPTETVRPTEGELAREIAPEIKDYITKLETGEEITLPQPVTDDVGQLLVSPAAPQRVTVTLPLTEEEMGRALHLKIIYSIRWLAEWMKRAIKIIGSGFIYKFKNYSS